MEFEIKRIRELCDVGSSKRIYAEQYVDEGVPFYRSKEIIEKNSNEELSEPLFISEEVYENIKKKYGVPKKGDILLTSVGTLGIPYLVKDEVFYFKDGNLTWFKNFKNDFDSGYLYYWFSSKFGHDDLVSRAIGSSQGAITIDMLKKHKILVPTYSNQKRIVQMVKNFDSQLENNNKRIILLEKIADSLFKEWFIRFRFPGHERFEKKESELGNIPSCFSILKANEIFDYYIGGGWGNEDCSEEFPIDAFVIRGTDFPYVSRGDISTCPFRYHKTSNYKPRQLKENDIILEISGGTAEQPVGRAVLVSKTVLDQFGGKAICASFCKLIRPNYSKITPNYLLYWFKFLYDTRMIERFQLQSTGIINFKFEYFLKKGPIMIPSKDLMDKFETFVGPIRNAINNLSLENAALIKQRDLLLPRLMSGKLSIEGKEII